LNEAGRMARPFLKGDVDGGEAVGIRPAPSRAAI
jgi:hypothetical protein